MRETLHCQLEYVAIPRRHARLRRGRRFAAVPAVLVAWQCRCRFGVAAVAVHVGLPVLFAVVPKVVVANRVLFQHVVPATVPLGAARRGPCWLGVLLGGLLFD